MGRKPAKPAPPPEPEPQVRKTSAARVLAPRARLARDRAHRHIVLIIPLPHDRLHRAPAGRRAGQGQRGRAARACHVMNETELEKREQRLLVGGGLLERGDHPLSCRNRSEAKCDERGCGL